MSKPIIVLTLITLMPATVQASFKALAKEFIQNNAQIAEIEFSQKSSEINRQQFLANKGWSTAIGTGYQKSKEQQQFGSSLINSTTDLKSVDLELKKGSLWGTDFSLKSSYVTGDSYGKEHNSFGQTLTINQDLSRNMFGAADRERRDVLSALEKSSQESANFQKGSSLLGFYQQYLNTQLQQALVELDREALSRSEKTRSLVKRKVSDGLRDRVDLIQANINVLSSKEQLNSTQSSLKRALAEVSFQLHRPVKEADIDKLDEKLISISVSDQDNNQLLMAEKERLIAAKKDAKIADYQTRPQVTLGASYKTSYIGDAEDVFSKGNLTNDKYKLTTGVQIVIPFGTSSQDLESERKNVAAKVQEAKFRAIEIKVKDEYEVLSSEMKILNQNISSVKQRVELAKKSIKEYSRLYKKGRVEIDTVINSEQALIQNQKVLASMIVNLKKINAQILQNRGVLERILK